MTDAMNPYLDAHQDKCLLEDPHAQQSSNTGAVFFTIDRKNMMFVENFMY